MTPPDEILEKLLNLTKVIEDGGIEERVHFLTHCALEFLQADHASTRLLDATGTKLMSIARAGDGVHKPPAAFNPEEGVIGWVLTEKKPVKVDDTASDDRFVEKEGQGFGIGSMLAIPMWSSDAVIGILTVTAKGTEEFDDGDLDLAQLLVNAASPALALARLHRLKTLAAAKAEEKP